ncbi:hypothetical protein ACWD5W_00165 [Streptomyces sp. NPDC002455]
MTLEPACLSPDGVLELPDGIESLNLHTAGDIVANGVTNPHAALHCLKKQPLADLIVKVSGL